MTSKDMLHEIMHAPGRECALEEIGLFSEEFDARYPKAAEKMVKDQDQLSASPLFPTLVQRVMRQ
jgi:hypothetical protein